MTIQTVSERREVEGTLRAPLCHPPDYRPSVLPSEPSMSGQRVQIE